MHHDSSFAARLPQGPLAVAVSGGVDSLCALLACLGTGREVLAVHARLHGEDHGDRAEGDAVAGLEATCAKLGVPFHLVDLRNEFEKQVVAPFVNAWGAGLTPNPCSRCNREIKFGTLFERALGLGAAGLVTGHYAALDHDHPYDGAGPLIRRARDLGKDQSYFLGLVPGERLVRVAFPLEGMTKSEARARVAAAGLAVPVPAESQEICFVPPTPNGYRDFLAPRLEKREETAGETAAGESDIVEGDIVEVVTGNTVGHHKGLWRYTEGQRRGLGIAWSEPLYVLGKDAALNRLYVGPKERTRVTRALVAGLNFHVAPQELPELCLARLRYRQEPQPARAHMTGAGRLALELLEPAQLSAPGQTAVLYDREGRLLAAGILESLA